ncbi:MAG: O-antigen ligase family protein [Pseudomonadota bacterium]
MTWLNRTIAVLQGAPIVLPAATRDMLLVMLWFFVTFKQFKYDELILYPLALYFGWAFIRDINLIFPLIKRSWVLFLFPTWWFMSAIWAVDPALVIRSGLQLLLTMMICYCAALRLEPRHIIFAMLVASCYFGFLSMMASFSGSGIAARGVFSSKNAMGAAMVILFMSSLVIVLDPKSNKLLRLASVGALALSVRQIGVANSATATLLMLALGGMICAGALMLRKGGLWHPAKLAVICGLISLGSLGAGGYLSFQEVNPVERVLASFGKDTTLTGRTDLWQYALREIEERPLLGVGHGGFWTPEDGTSTARRIYDDFHKRVYATFSFHNSYFEIAVHQGLIGLALAVIPVLWAFVRIIGATLNRGGMEWLFFTGICFMNLASSMTESALMVPFTLLSMTFWIGALMTLKLDDPVPKPERPRRLTMAHA